MAGDRPSRGGADRNGVWSYYPLIDAEINRLNQAETQTKALKTQLAKIDGQVSQLLTRILDTSQTFGNSGSPRGWTTAARR